MSVTLISGALFINVVSIPSRIIKRLMLIISLISLGLLLAPFDISGIFKRTIFAHFNARRMVEKWLRRDGYGNHRRYELSSNYALLLILSSFEKASQYFWLVNRRSMTLVDLFALIWCIYSIGSQTFIFNSSINNRIMLHRKYHLEIY